MRGRKEQPHLGTTIPETGKTSAKSTEVRMGSLSKAKFLKNPNPLTPLGRLPSPATTFGSLQATAAITRPTLVGFSRPTLSGTLIPWVPNAIGGTPPVPGYRLRQVVFSKDSYLCLRKVTKMSNCMYCHLASIIK